MTDFRPIHARAGTRALVLATLILAVSLMAGPAVAPAAAQSSETSTAEAYAFLRAVPGLKVGHLSVYGDAVGDVDGADAEWGAGGEIELSNKLRSWLQALIKSEYGWGSLPPKGAPVLITFVKLVDAPTLDGEQTAVLHLGLAGPGDLTVPGSQVDPANGTRLLHSAGVWFADGRFFPQVGTSPVSAGGVDWFGDSAKGGGGIVVPGNVLVHVVPLEKWARRYRLTVEGTQPFADPPVPPTRDVIYAPGGSQFHRLDKVLDLEHVACVSANVSLQPDGRRQVELSIEALGDYLPEDLARLRLETYDAAKERLGTVNGMWTTIPGMALLRGLFIVDDPAARSAAVAPPDGNALRKSASPLQLIGHSLRTGVFGLDGVGTALGTPHCGRVTSPAEFCGPEMTLAIASAELFADVGDRLDLTPGLSSDGSITCDVAVDAQPVARLTQGAQPIASARDVDTVVQATGCPVTGLGSMPEGALVACDSFTALLWRQLIPALDWANADGGVGVIQSILLYRPIPAGTLEAGDEIAHADLAQVLAPVMDEMMAVAEQADFTMAVAPPAAPG